MTIRLARPADAASVAAIWNPLIRETTITFNAAEHAEDALAAMIGERAQGACAFLVADIDGEVAGFATYAQFRAGIGYRHTMEHTIHLAPSARGRGLGRQLMAALETHAAERGVHSLIAGVSAENPGGRAFHVALGYDEIAVLPEVGRKFGRWIGLHLMQKVLGKT
nr:GNAT family N-acetyltransferase [Roseitranquillus sediminis]